MKTISRPTPYQLADAIERMVTRYGEAVQKGAFAYAEALEYSGEQRGSRADLEADRWSRIRKRRFRAIQWLTEALRKQADAQ